MEAVSSGDGLTGRPSVPSPVIRRRGSAADFHALSIEEMFGADRADRHRRSMWWFEVDSPVVVVSRGRSMDVLDLEACERTGVSVVERGSGGGPVLLEPGRSIWIDLVVPADDRRFVDDVVESMYGIGELWVEALAIALPDLGDRLSVHRGHQVRSEWSRQSCFAGLGPGEVLLDGHKLVGLSQRRSRHGARFQCLVHRSFDLGRHRVVLCDPPEEDPPAVAVLDVDPTGVIDALVGAFGLSPVAD